MKRPKIRRVTFTRALVNCPKCGAEYDVPAPFPGWKECPCGASIFWRDVEGTAQRYHKVLRMTKCPECGDDMPEHATLCGNCYVYKQDFLDWMEGLNVEAVRRGLEGWPLPAEIARDWNCWANDWNEGLSPAQALNRSQGVVYTCPDCGALLDHEGDRCDCNPQNCPSCDEKFLFGQAGDLCRPCDEKQNPAKYDLSTFFD